MSVRPDTASQKGGSVTRMLRYALPYTGWFLLALAIIFGTVAIELYQPLMLGKATDEFVNKYEDADNTGLTQAEIKEQRKEDLLGVVKLGVMYGLSVVISLGLTYAQAAILATIGQKIIYNMRTDVFTHLNKLHVGFFNDNPIGRL